MAFVVDAEKLKQLEAILCEIKGVLEYKVKFSDGSTIKYTDLQEIVSQPNSRKRAIVSIIASAEARAGHSAYVTLRDSPAPSVEYTINGPQRDVIYLGDKLDDWTAATARWYSAFFSSSSLSFVPVALAIALPFVVARGIARGYPINTGIPGAALILTAVAEFLSFKLFPRGTFAVGDGLKRSQWLSTFGVVVVLGFSISFLAGLLSNWATRNF